MLKFLLLAIILFSVSANSSEIDIPEHLWNDLDSNTQLSISNKYEVNIYLQSSYGLLIDAQILDKSSRGTNIGASIGSAYAQSKYIDNSFSGNSIDYSATNQLGYGLLGALVGSLLDKPAISEYQTRYTVKLANNNIEMFDEISSSENFTQSKGLCVATNPVKAVNQLLCTMSKNDLLMIASGEKIESIASNSKKLELKNQTPTTNRVKCKIGENSPTFLDENLCLSANGEIL
jgi:hypothetical protein